MSIESRIAIQMLGFDPFDPNLTLAMVEEAGRKTSKGTPKPTSMFVPPGCAPPAEVNRWKCGGCKGKGWYCADCRLLELEEEEYAFLCYACSDARDLHGEETPERLRETCEECGGSGLDPKMLSYPPLEEQ